MLQKYTKVVKNKKKCFKNTQFYPQKTFQHDVLRAKTFIIANKKWSRNYKP